MVYSTLTDRMGNNLFQIAAGASLAHDNNSDYEACITDFDLPDGTTLKDSIASYQNNILRKVSFREGIPADSIEYIQPGFHYEPIRYINNIRLTGYYQSEKFFNKDYIRELFAIDKDTEKYIQSKYGEILSGEIISLHVRRGDYVGRPRRQPVCSLRYYRKAMSYFGKEKKFLILSDDISWCKKNFQGKNIYFSENETSIVDLYLQTLCSHNIISNSSFSWWGAWLNSNPEKKVIAPKQWAGKHLSHMDMSDLVPENWIRLNNPKDLSLRLKIFWFDLRDFFDRKRGIVKFRG